MSLRKALFITAANRPNYFRETMNSWRKVRGFYDWNVIVRLEPSQFIEEHQTIVAELEHPKVQVIVNPQVLGVLRHPYVGFKDLFNIYTDFVVRAEDDLLVADDILEFFNWAAEKYYRKTSIGAVVAYSGEDGDDPSLVSKESGFSPWVWGTWHDRWEEYIAPTWDHDYSTYNDYPGNQAGWDWNLNTRVFPERGKTSVSPVQSRVQNIGVYGVHGTPENFAQSPSFHEHYEPVEYRERDSK